MRVILAGDKRAALHLFSKKLEFAKIDDKGASALIYAVRTRQTEWIEFLITNCSYYQELFKSVNTEIENAITTAIEHDLADMLYYIIDQIPDSLRLKARNFAMQAAALANKKTIVQKLNTLGASVSFVTPQATLIRNELINPNVIKNYRTPDYLGCPNA